jgi:hypothetical protein
MNKLEKKKKKDANKNGEINNRKYEKKTNDK